MEYLGQWVGGAGGSQGQPDQGGEVSRIISVRSSPSQLIGMFPHIIDFHVCPDFCRNKLKTHQDVIPISCLTEFPNVVQMAKVRRQTWPQHLCQTSSEVVFFCSLPARLWRCERGSLFPCPLPKSKVQFGSSRISAGSENSIKSKPRVNKLLWFKPLKTRINCRQIIQISVFFFFSFLFFRLRDLLLPLMNTSSATISSLGSFIKSLDRWATNNVCF